MAQALGRPDDPDNGLTELGKRGWFKQAWGFYHEAIEIYTDGIRKYSHDSRFYNNRCLCYIEIKDYKKAMKDAERMILLFPENKKSFYRKGQVLLKLGKYEEAEIFFKKVLDLDAQCEEARLQAREAQISQIIMGSREFSREQALQALNFTGNVKDAREALQNKTIEAQLKTLEDIIYVSDTEDDAPSSNKPKPNPLQDPNNPYRSPSLWVGNIPEGVSVPFLMSLFSKYGKLKSVRPLYPAERFLGAAFINFYDSTSAGNAMKNLQGVFVRDKKLCIKYPRSVLPAAASQTSRGISRAVAPRKDRCK